MTMGDKSGIEWTDATWNPVVGCSVLSAGCKNCYAMRMAGRLEKMGGRTGEKYAGLTKPGKNGPVWTGEVRLDPGALVHPLLWKRPRRIFVNSMSDLGHPGLYPLDVCEVFAVMAVAAQHHYQVLTKRPERLASLLLDKDFRDYIGWKMPKFWPRPYSREGVEDAARRQGCQLAYNPPPFANVIIGASVEDQASADARRDALAAIAAAGWRTFVSYEPALGPVDWSGWEFLAGMISGGESGPHARPSHPDWHRAARDFAAAHGIPYCFKQWGEWLPLPRGMHPAAPARPAPSKTAIDASGASLPFGNDPDPTGGCRFVRVGKKAAGRLLDGFVHDGRIE
jgi:protein gp37